MKYPVGIQTFSKIREGNYLYIDKTELIYQLAHDYEYVFLSRPRRFGKSLLLSTLQAYFEGRKELFEGLAIEKVEKDWKQYPVLKFDLSGASYLNPKSILEKLDMLLSSYEKVYGVDKGSAYTSMGTRFFNLIWNIHQKTKKKIVVLIDECEKSLVDLQSKDGFPNAIENELGSFYAVIKSCDEYMKFAMLTGVTKFNNVNIFSGLNNLENISLNPDFNAICGISETEFRNNFKESIKDFSKVRKISEEETWNLFKVNYDGYLFAENEERIYNPISLLKAFENNIIADYWQETHSCIDLATIISTYHFDPKKPPIRTGSQLRNIISPSHDLVPFLYQTGYLTIQDYEEEDDEYTLEIPNLEVKRSFWDKKINR